jgi:exodeoxyribonuclease VII large subunit
VRPSATLLENARRRWPAVRIIARYALVQGPQACEQLIGAVQHLDRHPDVDVIIIARGGRLGGGPVCRSQTKV